MYVNLQPINQTYVICCHDIYINPLFHIILKSVLVCFCFLFFFCHKFSNPTLESDTQVHAGREKRGNKQLEMQTNSKHIVKTSER